MSRPRVSVVVPFAGDRVAAVAALRALLEINTLPGDELIVADNSGAVGDAPGVKVVRAEGERSPSHARNAGAEHASGEWVLFLDADCQAPANLLDLYFAAPVEPGVGALAGEVVPSADASTLAARYGAARSFLSQEAHLAHAYRPRAVAANLLVRREAFEQVGGFFEGVRAAEDTDFSWRLQQAGWQLELRPEARVEHRYRATVTELRRQWRGYAAGRAWLSRRYEGFVPEPAVRRALTRLTVRLRRGEAPRRGGQRAGGRRGGGRRGGGRRTPATRPIERGRYLALDALLAAEELAGLALSNRPASSWPERRGGRWSAPVDVVLVAERFPAAGDPLVDYARTLERARVEAGARPDSLLVAAARELRVEYREDDGAAARLLAFTRLLARHPVRGALDLLRHKSGAPSLAALSPAALRLEREPHARVQALGGPGPRATARRLALLAGRVVDERRDDPS